MGLISIIFLAIVLVVQTVLCITFVLTKKHIDRRFDAFLDYVDRGLNSIDCEEEVMEAVEEKMSKMIKDVYNDFYHSKEDLFDFKRAITEKLMELTGKVDTLAVDYTEAQQAADKVNDFASSLSSIFDYDPIRTLQRGRSKEAH